MRKALPVLAVVASVGVAVQVLIASGEGNAIHFLSPILVLVASGFLFASGRNGIIAACAGIVLAVLDFLAFSSVSGESFDVAFAYRQLGFRFMVASGLFVPLAAVVVLWPRLPTWMSFGTAGAAVLGVVLAMIVPESAFGQLFAANMGYLLPTAIVALACAFVPVQVLRGAALMPQTSGQRPSTSTLPKAPAAPATPPARAPGTGQKRP